MFPIKEFFHVERLGPLQVLVGLDQGPIRNRSRVRKVGSLPGDAHQDGALATVVGAVGPATEKAKAELRRCGLLEIDWIYWVAWDDMPGIPVAIPEHRIEEVQNDHR